MIFMIYIINANEIDTTKINLFYLEPGYSFMLADSFHHQVELSLKKIANVYDFMDFEKVISRSKSEHVEAKVMTLQDFYN